MPARRPLFRRTERGLPRTFWLGAAACYLLGYGLILALAARKGLDLTDTYALLVWMVSALALSALCGIAALVLAVIVGRFRVRWATTLALWGSLTLLSGIMLILNAA